MSIQMIHYVNFHSDAHHAICGWVPPADYAGATVFLSSATCPACIAAIQARIAALAPPGRERRHRAFFDALKAAPPLGDDAVRLSPGWAAPILDDAIGRY